jgi:hypothetical protein
MRPYLKKITKAKKGRECGSTSRAPAWQAQGPEFQPQISKTKIFKFSGGHYTSVTVDVEKHHIIVGFV